MPFFLVSLVLLAVLVMIAVPLLRRRIPSGPPITGEVAVADGILAETNARNLSDVDAVAVDLTIDTERSLYIILAADGSIKRMGTGDIDKPEKELFIGKTEPAIFEEVRTRLNEEMLKARRDMFQARGARGAVCKLIVSFKFKDGIPGNLGFVYGADSEGPPEDVAEFVRTAVRLTDPWYEKFKQAVAAQRKT
jgi:hypothetical protein